MTATGTEKRDALQVALAAADLAIKTDYCSNMDRNAGCLPNCSERTSSSGQSSTYSVGITDDEATNIYPLAKDDVNEGEYESGFVENHGRRNLVDYCRNSVVVPAPCLRNTTLDFYRNSTVDFCDNGSTQAFSPCRKSTVDFCDNGSTQALSPRRKSTVDFCDNILTPATKSQRDVPVEYLGPAGNAMRQNRIGYENTRQQCQVDNEHALLRGSSLAECYNFAAADGPDVRTHVAVTMKWEGDTDGTGLSDSEGEYMNSEFSNSPRRQIRCNFRRGAGSADRYSTDWGSQVF